MNIVTIDFDIIMRPSIELYNDYIGDTVNITDVINDYPLLGMANADLNIYEYLTRYLVKVFKKLDKKKIYFVHSHEMVVPLVSKYKDINLVNIDHHHDLGYGEKTTAYGMASCGNWAKKLLDLRLLSSYTWVSNPESSMLPEEFQDREYIQDVLLEDYSLDELADKTDMLIICESFDWIPPQFRPLYFAWVGIYEEFTGSQYPMIDNDKKI